MRPVDQDDPRRAWVRPAGWRRHDRLGHGEEGAVTVEDEGQGGHLSLDVDEAGNLDRGKEEHDPRR